VKTTSKSILCLPRDYNRAAVMSAIEHEKLRFMERRMKKGKRKRSNSRNTKEPVLSQYYSDDPLSDSTKVEDAPQVNGQNGEALPSPGCSNSVPSSSNNGAKHPGTDEDIMKNYALMLGSPPPVSMGMLPSGLFTGPLGPPNLPFGVSTAPPDPLNNQSVDSIKFHQTLQMLQLQSQLHLQQQALTQQLPPSERARVLDQQDMMRQAFNSLLVQQLAKLEEKQSTPPHSIISTAIPLPVPLPAPIMTAQLGGLWPQVSAVSTSHLCPPSTQTTPSCTYTTIKSEPQAFYSYHDTIPSKSEAIMSPPSLKPETSFSYPSIVNALQRSGEPSQSQWTSDPNFYSDSGNTRKRKSSEAEMPYISDMSHPEDLNFSPKLSGSLSSRDELSPHLSPQLMHTFEAETSDGLSPMSKNPMFAMQPRLLVEDDKPYLDLPSDAKMKSALEFASLLSDPAFKNSLCANPPSISSPSNSEPPKLYEESQNIQRNLALVESVLSAEGESLFSESSTPAEVESDAAMSSTDFNEDSNASEGVSNPGWFGKGWNPKKFRRKKKVK
jgi:hypothetical protein